MAAGMKTQNHRNVMSIFLIPISHYQTVKLQLKGINMVSTGFQKKNSSTFQGLFQG